MPDRRRHRGKHPGDEALFGTEQLPTLRCASDDLCLLLSRGYNERSALKLVGDRYALVARQRKALSRCSCGAEQATRRKTLQIPLTELDLQEVAIDGFNVLITLETALSGGAILLGQDGCCRDLSGIHGTYRAVAETPLVLQLVGAALADRGVKHALWWLDRPVSNSGRLKQRIEQVAKAQGWPWSVELHVNPDRALVAQQRVVLSADSWIIENCPRWANLVRWVVEHQVEQPWIVDLQAER